MTLIFFRQKNRGFTLVETLVAISIFTTSILALLVVLSQSISSTNYAKKKLVASYLAQEGVEYIRNVRDTYVLYSATSQEGWDDFTEKLSGASCSATNGCYFNDQNIDYTEPVHPMENLTMNPCSSSCPTILYNAATGKYGYSSGTNSGFSRRIRVTEVSPDELKISSIVYWAQGSGTYNISFSESLFNWVE